MISIWIAVLLAQAVSAPSVSASARVTGRVVNSFNGDRVANAVVILRAYDTEHWLSYADETDTQGHFSIPEVEPGEYAIVVERAGFVLESTGATGAPAPSLKVEAGQPRNDLALRVTPLGVIEGRIVDSDGEAARGARVNALHYVYGDTNRFIFRLYREDGSAIWVEMLGSPMIDAHGTITGTIGVFKVLKLAHSEDETVRLTATAGYRD